MGDILNRLNAQRASEEASQREQDRRLRSLWIARTPSLARAAVAQIRLQGTYNTRPAWAQRVVTLRWRGDDQLAWNIRPLDKFALEHFVEDRFIALVETGDVVYVVRKNGRDEITPYDPDALDFSVTQVGSVYVSIITVVDNYEFSARNFSSDPREMLTFGPVAT